MKELKDNLKSGDFKRVYLFYGAEAYLKKHYENQALSHIVPAIAFDMNVTIFENNIDITKIIDLAETAPFFSERRVIVIRYSGLFKTGKKNDSEALADYIPNIMDFSTIIFVEDEVDKRGKLYKAVSKIGMATEFKTPTEKELISWTKNIFTKSKKDIAPKTLLYFLQSIENNLENILSEANKLIDFKQSDSTITQYDIDEICSKSLEAKIFDMVDFIGNKKVEEAIKIYNNLLFLKESPIAILAMIARQFRIMLQSKQFNKEGYSKSQIASITGHREFVIDVGLRQSKNFSTDKLKAALDECLETDLKIKTGKIAPDTGVLLVIVAFGASACS